MHLGLALNAIGFHVAAWRHPEARPELASDLRRYAAIAATAERGRFDFLFLADSAAVHQGADVAAMSRMAPFYQMEPLTLLASLAVLTERIGLVASVTTTYNEPFHIARKIATLDHLSFGRAGWNLVTSANQAEAFNFSRDTHMAHADRYVRAREAAQIVRGLWDSWEDDAFLYDKAGGRFFDPTKLHVLGHEGSAFSVLGPLNVNRPPQGHPVIAQAGSSEPGMELAAETADLVFTQQTTLAAGRAFYADVKGRMARFGRSPDQLKIMPGLVPYAAPSQAEADEEFERLQGLILPEVGLALLRELLGGADLSGHDLDGPVPDITDSNAGKARLGNLMRLAREKNLSIRQLYQHVASSRGHWVLRGTPGHIADVLEEWVQQDAADGFIIVPPTLPGALDRFVDLVVPELQRRGLFRTGYEGTTLREHLGLARPANSLTIR